MAQVVPLVMAFSAATYEGVELFPTPRMTAAAAGAAIVFLIVTLGTLPWRWRTKRDEERRRMLWMIPNRLSDLWWWALVAMAAGFGEEIVYRGVMFELWRRMLGSWLGAAAICVVVFTLAHFVQGRRAMAIIALIAAGFHAMVWLNGNLYAAMAVHAVYDFVAGWAIMRLAYRDGLLKADEGADGGRDRE
jgi:membrane protease YdiL (CAAX protease family)